MRAFCAACLDPLVGADRFDFVLDLGAEMPMRAIGMLVGIPDADQPTVRDARPAQAAQQARRAAAGRPRTTTSTATVYAEYVAWRAEEPVRRPRSPSC